MIRPSPTRRPGRRPPPLRSLFLLLALGLLLAPPAQGRAQDPADAPSPAERIHGLSLIWREAAYNFPYFDQLPGLDWDAAYRRAIPPVLAARSTLEYYRELQRFTALLQDGHTRVHLPDSIVQRRPFSSPWVELDAVGGRALVANVATELADSLPPGSEIVGVEDMALDDYLERHVLPYVFASAPHSRRISAIEGSHARGYGALVGPAERPVGIRARTPAGAEVRLTLARDRFSAERQWLRAPEEARPPVLELAWPETGVAYLALNSFADPGLVSRVDSVLPRLLDARGVILDLRRNGGGNDEVALAVLARFTDRPLVGTAWRVRVNDAYYRALGSFGRAALERALPAEDSALVERALRHHAGDAWRLEEADTVRPAYDGERITGPVAVLVGRGTASAAENFLVRLPDDGRFVLVGAPTAASTGQPLRFLLPGGGTGQVVTRAVLLPDGTPLVKVGIVPDVLVAPTPEDVRSGRDPVLDRALELLRQGAGARPSGSHPPPPATP